MEKVYLSIVENEDTTIELGTTFVIYPSLVCLMLKNTNHPSY